MPSSRCANQKRTARNFIGGPGKFRKKSALQKLFFPYDWRFRAPGLVQKHAEKIRNYFRPVEEHENSGRRTIDSLRRNADIVVGVHIRHGDYRHFMGGKYFSPASRYADLDARNGRAIFPDRKMSFFVCSDDPRNAGEFPGLSVGFGAGPPVADLFTLAKCDLVCGPVSTFSQWASFYGAKPLLHFSHSDERIDLPRFAASPIYGFDRVKK